MRNIFTLLFIISLLFTFSCERSNNPSQADIQHHNILLIIIDTLRADHTGYCGYERNTTPVLDSIAEAGIAYTQMQSQSSWTLPAVTSILSGITPREHCAVRKEGILYGLDSSMPVLQNILHSYGWTTGGFFNVVFLSEDFGFHRGFDHFDCQGVSNRQSLRKADTTVDDVLEWINTIDKADPFLAVVHFYDPHLPYNPPAPYDTLFTTPGYSGEYGEDWGTVSQLVEVNDEGFRMDDSGLYNLTALYDGEIAFTDVQIGRLIDSLDTMGLAEDLLVIIAADHGEEFYEHGGIEHGRTLYQEVTRVPLIISGPTIPMGVTSNTPVTQIDLLPTILEYLGIDTRDLKGRNILAPEFPDMNIPASDLLWTTVNEVSIRRNDLKLIWKQSTGNTELYDLEQDPSEQSPLNTPNVLLIEAVELYWATPPLYSPPAVPLEESINNQLRDLGYLR